MAPNWSELQTDVLELILQRLSPIDTIRFRAVCSSWNTAVLARRRYVSPKSPPSLPAPPPWLFQTPSPTSLQTASLRFFNPAEEYKSYSIKIPSFEENYRGSECFGSCYGWLTILNSSKDSIHLVNPFSGDIVRVQFHLCDGLFPPVWFAHKVVLSSDPSCNPGDFSVVVAITTSSEHNHESPRLTPAISKFVDCGSGIRMLWALFDVHNENYDDMICHNGMVYAFSNLRQTLSVWDLNKFYTSQALVLEPYPMMVDPRWILPQCSSRYQVRRTCTLLVESLGEILFVEPIHVRFADDYEYGSGSSITIGFLVSKLMFSERRRVSVRALPGRAILLGSRNQALSVSTRNSSEFQEDSIYFVDGNDRLMKVYNLKEGKVTVCGRQCGRLKFDQPYNVEHSNHWMFPVFKIC